jgi:group I intron endonuclease
MYKGVIYKYTSPNGKCYIGQTVNEDSRRKDFLRDENLYAGPKVNKARDKHGVRNFQYDIIFKVESFIESEVKELLNEKEVQYIKLFDSFENGYNSDLGGGSATYVRTDETKLKNSEAMIEYYETHKSHVARKVLQFDLKGNFIDE